MQFRARNALPGTPSEIDAGAVTAADVCAPAGDQGIRRAGSGPMTEASADALRPHELAVPMPGRFDAQLWFIGRIHTPWTGRGECPRRGDPDNGPDCRIELFEPWAPGLSGIAKHDRLQILYWMHQARRDLVLQNPNYGDGATGTFALRSPVRPNPVASSVVRLLTVDGPMLTVRGLDCLNGTPLIDIKAEFGAAP